MSDLNGLREQLRDVLKTAGLNAFTAIPEKVTPPFVAVAPDEPYISYDEPSTDLMFGEVLVRHRLVLVGRKGTNDVQIRELSDLIVKVLGLADQFEPHQIVSVGEPGRIAVNAQDHLGVAINLTVRVNLT